VDGRPLKRKEGAGEYEIGRGVAERKCQKAGDRKNMGRSVQCKKKKKEPTGGKKEKEKSKVAFGTQGNTITTIGRTTAVEAIERDWR